MIDILKAPIESFDLSARLKNKLISNGILTFEDVLNNEEKIFNIEQLGQKCFSELDMVFEDFNIKTDFLNNYQKKLKQIVKTMKLEIIKEEEFNSPTWYILKANDRTIVCSKDLTEVELHYEKIKENPNLVNPLRIILKSEEINVNL